MTETYTAADVQQLAVDVGDGTLDLDSHDGSSLEVEATKYAVGDTDLSDVAVFHEESNGRLRLGAELPGGFRFGLSGGGLERLAVRVPEGVSVERVDVADGTGMVGPISGNPTVSVADGEAEFESVAGDATVDVADGSCRFGTLEGISASVGDGELAVDQPTELGDVDVADGTVRLAVGGVDSPASVTASDGTVQLRLSSDLDLTVRVQTGDGAVTLSEQLFDSVSRDDDVVRGQIGDGTQTLDIETADGSVTVEPLQPG